MKKTRKNESGRSMIEIVGVLAVTGLLTAGAFVLITSGMSSQKRRRATDEANTIAQAVRALAADGEDFGNLPGPSATGVNQDGHKLAKALLKTSGVTPFGDNSYYMVTQADADHNRWWYGWHDLEVPSSHNVVLFRVGLTNLDENDCYLLAEQGWGDAWDTSCVNGSVYLY